MFYFKNGIENKFKIILLFLQRVHQMVKEGCSKSLGNHLVIMDKRGIRLLSSVTAKLHSQTVSQQCHQRSFILMKIHKWKISKRIALA